MIPINPREVAADALYEIIKEDAYNNAVLKRLLRQNGAMPREDRALVTELVNGSLRNQYYIDYILNKVSTIKTDKMKPFVLSVLRISIYQIKFMDRIPDAAACNEAVNLIKKRGFRPLSGFVNGVLRSCIRMKEEDLFPDKEETPVQYLEVKYSHPAWLVKMWLHAYPFAFVEELCEKNNTPPNMSVCCNTLKTTPAELIHMLEDAGVVVKPGGYVKNALHLEKTADIAKLPPFINGLFHVQDESSMLAVDVLDPKPGERILDACAAPGGKSLYMAEKMGESGEIIARDIYDHKIELIEESVQRLGITTIKAVLADSAVNDPAYNGQFDRVLIDAPCTGFGLIRKKPDIRFRKNGNDIDSLSKLQKEILSACAGYVKPGGILVYSTCTICSKENQKNAEWFLNNFPFEAVPLTAVLPDSLKGPEAEKGYLQLFPHIHGTDGFFIAKFRRKQEEA